MKGGAGGDNILRLSISSGHMEYAIHNIIKPYMIYSLFHIMYLNVLSAASIPRPHSTQYLLLSACHVPGIGLSAIKADLAPEVREWTLC